MYWQLAAFDQLSARHLFAAYQLRQQVFVVEQDCPYLDADNKDLDSYHLLAWLDDQLQACLRLVPPGISYKEPSIGRVVVNARQRGSGLGRELMLQGLQQAAQLWPEHSIRISAQQYLQQFYQSLGFEVVSGPYDEDGIPHIEMLIAAELIPKPPLV